MTDELKQRISRLEKLAASGRDNALLRFSLGCDYLQAGHIQDAVENLKLAVEHNNNFSAAYKQLGKALVQSGNLVHAQEVYVRGIEVAEKAGDKQAVKEMQVFLKRLKNQVAAQELQ